MVLTYLSKKKKKMKRICCMMFLVKKSLMQKRKAVPMRLREREKNNHLMLTQQMWFVIEFVYIFFAWHHSDCWWNKKNGREIGKIKAKCWEHWKIWIRHVIWISDWGKSTIQKIKKKTKRKDWNRSAYVLCRWELPDIQKSFSLLFSSSNNYNNKKGMCNSQKLILRKKGRRKKNEIIKPVQA